MFTPWKESYDQPREHIKKQRHYFANKGLSSQGYGFSTGHVWMWELDCEEGWAPKNWRFWTVVLEKTLESPLDCKEIQPVHSEGDQPWDFFGRNDAKAEAPVLWPPHVKSWLIGKDWCWEGLGARGEGDDRGWDVWMASLAWWLWVWVNSGRWWWTGRPGVLWFMGLQSIGHDWATELNWTFIKQLLCARHMFKDCYIYVNSATPIFRWNHSTWVHIPTPQFTGCMIFGSLFNLWSSYVIWNSHSIYLTELLQQQ